jgi:hypothetical protein
MYNDAKVWYKIAWVRIMNEMMASSMTEQTAPTIKASKTGAAVATGGRASTTGCHPPPFDLYLPIP